MTLLPSPLVVFTDGLLGKVAKKILLKKLPLWLSEKWWEKPYSEILSMHV